MSTLEIPEVCGAMLLPDCTLFPHGGMPLRIFEPRYRQMLENALAESCFFAVGRLIAEESDPLEECVAPIGTVGLIRASREMDDGTSNLMLHGVIRVKFKSWVEDSDYPLAKISPLASVFTPKKQSKAAIAALHDAAENATKELPGEVQTAVMEMTERIDDPAVLVDVLCQHFVHEPDERQEMLEMESVAARVAWFCRRFGS